MPTSPPFRNRTQLLLLALLFLGPFVGAYWLYFYQPGWRPSGHTNYGELVEPARPLPVLTLADADGVPYAQDRWLGHWSLVLLGSADCDAGCIQRLYLTRQVRTRLDRDRARVQRIYVAPDAAALASVRTVQAGTHPDVVWLQDRGPPGQRLADFFGGAPAQTSIELLDPRGNWLLRYAPESTPKGLYMDLKKLLGLSTIG
jgi:cytochrome oxidase Cu insertion factor (SCO1/SenC/PrrC family)